jgi:DNA-directed RNA polymerase specialized sigma subunit
VLREIRMVKMRNRTMILAIMSILVAVCAFSPPQLACQRIDSRSIRMADVATRPGTSASQRSLGVETIDSGARDRKESFKKDYDAMEKSRYVRATPGRLNFNQFGLYQKRSHNVAVELFKKYSKLRLLTQEEEVIAGKFASLGGKLTRVRELVKTKLQREPTDLEWAAACKIPPEQLDAYLDISQKSKNRLVQHNIRMVELWAKKLSLHSDVANTISYAELMVEGVVGLTKAAERYDGRGVRFYHFAEVYVRSALLQAVTKLKSGSTASHQAVMIATRARKASAVLAKQLGRQPTSGELAEALGVTLKYLLHAQRDYKIRLTSGDQPVADGVEATPWDFVVKDNGDGDGSGPESYGEQQHQLQEAIMEAFAISGLKSVEKRILALSYGLLDGQERNISLVAQLMCMSDEGVRLHLQAAQSKVSSSPSAQAIMCRVRVRSVGDHVTAGRPMRGRGGKLLPTTASHAY